MCFERIMCLLVVSVLPLSCSVKEDRSGCPCALGLDLTAVREKVRDEDYPVLLRVEGERTDYTGWLDEEDCSGFFQIVVPDKRVRVWVVAGDEGLFDSGVEIPAGHGSPPLTWWRGDVDTDGETAFCKVLPQKDYCCLTLRINGPFGALAPYTMTIRGHIGGYSGPGEPLEGDFSCIPPIGVPLQGGTRPLVREYRVFLPRQTDDSLRLEVRSEGGGIRTFALGEYIAATGYDWTARDLGDLTVEVDCALTDILVTGGGWKDGIRHEVVF